MLDPMRRLVLPVVLLACLVAACGGDDGDGGASSEACPSDAVTIKMADIKFDPEDATVSSGQTVCWVNEDTIDHDVVAESGASFKSELFGKGQTFTATVDAPGTVQYICTIHPGMTGKLTVN
jgi:plastocyanin